MNLLNSFFSVFGMLSLIALGFKVFIFIDVATRPAPSFTAANKMTKPFWLIIMGIAVAWNLLFPSLLGFVNLAGLAAAIIYLVDVRPAVRALGRGSRGGGTMGPYGPW